MSLLVSHFSKSYDFHWKTFVIFGRVDMKKSINIKSCTLNFMMYWIAWYFLCCWLFNELNNQLLLHQKSPLIATLTIHWRLTLELWVKIEDSNQPRNNKNCIKCDFILKALNYNSTWLHQGFNRGIIAP